ncbi:unnamed protein product [Mytilus coruscus]|uniref:Reverse transcriptase domain-containing protein n=1 Tax=Mytilus coruscus TaxID=42192 RepID=A0A6J8DNQ9_MYTCO|nr:unnamed protein product [Mytilus coruscus]
MKGKPISEDIKKLIQISKKAHWKWKNEGGGRTLLYIDCKEAKRNLRKAQRQLEAENRNNIYFEIMDITNRIKTFSIDLYVGREVTHKASKNELFNKDYKELVERDLDALRKLYDVDKPIEKFTNVREIYNIISTMSNGKAPDELSLMAEHLKNEVLAEAIDGNYPLHAVFIDASKAFDVVWHASLLRKLHCAGIKDNDWKILDIGIKNLLKGLSGMEIIRNFLRKNKATRRNSVTLIV